MPSLPIPMISALALGFLFAALVLKRDRHWLLAVLVGACALQGVVISLGQHYGGLCCKIRLFGDVSV